MKLHRYEKNPIIAPDPRHDWESLVATNPGVWYDANAGKVIMLYRAAGSDAEHVVRLALATSTDGYNFERHSEPVFSPSTDGFDAGCVEDPRIVKFGDCYMITYAARPFPPGEYWLFDPHTIPASSCPREFSVRAPHKLDEYRPAHHARLQVVHPGRQVD